MGTKTKSTILMVFFVSVAWQTIPAQNVNSLTIDSCFAMAQRHYPLLGQLSIIDKTQAYTLDNASKGYLPQVNINGQATYQSDVTKVPFSFPGVTIQPLDKDQYKIYAEINQSLTDPFIIRQQKDLIRTSASIEQQKVEVELYKLKERISNLFFGIMLMDAQIAQIKLLKRDIQSGLDKTNAAIANGTALKSNADLLKVELLKADQRITELNTTRKGYADMLSLFINANVDEKTQMMLPDVSIIDETNNRPELKLFEMQSRSFDYQHDLLKVKNMPRISFFLQGGYGKPALNLFNNEFNTYYIGGLRLNWSLTGYYTYKKDNQLLAVSQDAVMVQKETFLFNTSLLMKQQNSDVARYEVLMKSDGEIITLREKIKTTAQSQLENGAITANDFITFINAEDQARQNLELHKIQMLMAKYNYKISAGN